MSYQCTGDLDPHVLRSAYFSAVERGLRRKLDKKRKLELECELEQRRAEVEARKLLPSPSRRTSLTNRSRMQHESLSSAERETVTSIADRLGETEAAKALLVHRITLCRALAGRALRPSTVQCIRSRLVTLAARRAE